MCPKVNGLDKSLVEFPASVRARGRRGSQLFWTHMLRGESSCGYFFVGLVWILRWF